MIEHSMLPRRSALGGDHKQFVIQSLQQKKIKVLVVENEIFVPRTENQIRLVGEISTRWLPRTNKGHGRQISHHATCHKQVSEEKMVGCVWLMNQMEPRAPQGSDADTNRGLKSLVHDIKTKFFGITPRRLPTKRRM